MKVVVCCNDKVELILPRSEAEELCRDLNAIGKPQFYWHTHEVPEGLPEGWREAQIRWMEGW